MGFFSWWGASFSAAGGILLGSIDLLTFVALSVAAWRFLMLREVRAREEEVIAQGEGDPRVGLPPQTGSLSLEQLLQDLDRLARGSKPAGIEAIRPLLEARRERLESGLGLLATIAVVLPMTGLLGTVFGMIQCFSSLGVDGDPAALSDGMGAALLTTQAGLVAALPVLFAHGLLRSQVRRVLDRGELFLRSHAHRREQERGKSHVV